MLPLKLLPLVLSRKLSPYFSQIKCGGTTFFLFGPFLKSLHGGCPARWVRHSLQILFAPASPSQSVLDCSPHLLLFKYYFSTQHLPIARESSKIPLFCVFTVIPSILIPGRSTSLQSQGTHYTPFISTQPQSYVRSQEETFPMQRMTQTRSKQRQKESGEKWTVTAVYKRWHLSHQSDSCSLWCYQDVLWFSDSEAHLSEATDLEYEKTTHAEKVIFNKMGSDSDEAHSCWVAF